MSKKQLLIVGLVIVSLIFVGYFFFGKNENYMNYPPKNKTVVAFGDSLVQGVGATSGNDFISRVGNNLGIKIINKGASGDTTVTALARINDALLSDPGTVIILLGGNDILRRIPKKETFENLAKIIEAFQKKGSLVVLLGVQGSILFDSYEDSFEDLSKKYDTAYVSNVLNGLIGNQKYMSDGIHPNDQGYAIIAERLIPVLEKILK